MGEGVAKRGGKKNRKWNRNRAKCQAYAMSKRLERRKVRNLVRCNGYATELEAAHYWHGVRQRRWMPKAKGH